MVDAVEDRLAAIDLDASKHVGVVADHDVRAASIAARASGRSYLCELHGDEPDPLVERDGDNVDCGAEPLDVGLK